MHPSPIVPLAGLPSFTNADLADFKRFRAAHPDALTQFQVYVLMRQTIDELLHAAEAQHSAIDQLLAMQISADRSFRPTQCALWPQIVRASEAIAAARGVL
jgi:hypothetical protein